MKSKVFSFLLGIALSVVFVILVLIGIYKYCENKLGSRNDNLQWQVVQNIVRSRENYAPYRQVELDSTNLPVVVIETRKRHIKRDKKIEAKMFILSDSMNVLSGEQYNKLLAENGIDILIRYRGNSSFQRSDKKPYLINLLQDTSTGGVKCLS